jgi:transposase
MGTTQKRYSAELQEQLVRLARSGRSPKELSREFELSEQTIRNWVWRAPRELNQAV